jgi:hypothetical protein
MKIRIPVSGYITDYAMKYNLTPEDMKNPEKVQKHLQISQSNMADLGWVKVGLGYAEVELLDQKDVLNSAVIALRAKAAATRAEATKKCTEIENQINQLLAIENKS